MDTEISVASFRSLLGTIFYKFGFNQRSWAFRYKILCDRGNARVVKKGRCWEYTAETNAKLFNELSCSERIDARIHKGSVTSHLRVPEH